MDNNLPTHTASEVLIAFAGRYNSFDLLTHLQLGTEYKPLAETLEALTTELRAVLPKKDKSVVDYNREFTEGYNLAIEEVTTALYKYMGRPELAHGTDSGSHDKSGASDE